MKRYWLYIVVILTLFGILVYVKATEQEEPNWTSTYSKNDKIAFGSYALYDLLQGMHKNSIEPIDTPLYFFLQDYQSDEDTGYNIIIVSTGLYFNKAQAKSLLDFVQKGNEAFIAVNGFTSAVADTLKIGSSISHFSFLPETKDSISLAFTNPQLQTPDTYQYDPSRATGYFKDLDSENITVLGRNSLNEPNFLKVQWGKGHIYLHAVPYAFTNYALLEKNHVDYVFKSLSYLPRNNYTFWDEYDKPIPGGLSQIKNPNGMYRDKHYSQLSVILSNEPLRWAYYITMLSILLYVFFEGKRRQRIIPVIEPLKNTTVEFVQTVGQLYFHNGSHKNIAEKKISHFYDFLRQRLYLRFTHIDEKLYQQISIKTGVPTEEVESIFRLIDRINHGRYTMEDELIVLNEKIDNFYKRIKR